MGGLVIGEPASPAICAEAGPCRWRLAHGVALPPACFRTWPRPFNPAPVLARRLAAVPPPRQVVVEGVVGDLAAALAEIPDRQSRTARALRRAG